MFRLKGTFEIIGGGLALTLIGFVGIMITRGSRSIDEWALFSVGAFATGLVVTAVGGVIFLARRALGEEDWEKSKVMCEFCSKEVPRQRIYFFSDGFNACTDCFADILNHQRTCAKCGKPITANEKLAYRFGNVCHDDCCS
jgi:endogenous inhibitor of DNA gyrase (YacG/DUF329 family)